jgi:hypothetical protein
MIKIIKYWFGLVKELRLLYKYRKAARSLTTELEANNLRVDWLGRIYTVINLKEELLQQPELMQQSFVLSELKPITQFLMKYGLADSSFPEIQKIEGSQSYLVVLYPETDHVGFSVILVNTLVTLVVAGVITIAIKWVPWEWVMNTVKTIQLPK